MDGEPAAELLRGAKAAGATTSLDTVWTDLADWMEVLRPMLPHVDVFMSSREEAQRISGESGLDAIARFFAAM